MCTALLHAILSSTLHSTAAHICAHLYCSAELTSRRASPTEARPGGSRGQCSTMKRTLHAQEVTSGASTACEPSLLLALPLPELTSAMCCPILEACPSSICAGRFGHVMMVDSHAVI